MEGEYLPFAFCGQLVAAGETLDDQAALGRAVSFTHDVLVRAHAFRRQRQGKKAVFLVLRKGAYAAQLTKQHAVLGMKFCGASHALSKSEQSSLDYWCLAGMPTGNGLFHARG